ncbi:MAG: hypothetical protein Aurels2KO_37540 [Aureliella sp.]
MTKKTLAPTTQQRRAFSLLELLAVVTILGVVAAVVVPRISVSGVAAKKEMCKQHVAEVNRALERYFVQNGELTTDLSQLNGPDYFPDGVPSCPLLSTPYKVDNDTRRLKPCGCTQ